MQTLNNWQINGLSFTTVNANTTSAQYFPAPTANFTTGAGSTPNASSAKGQMAVPGENKLNGQMFTVIASGDVTTGVSGTVTIDLVANTGTVASPSYTVLATTGAATQSAFATPQPWEIELVATGSTLAGFLTGYQNVTLAAQALKQTAIIANPLSGLVFGPSSTATQDQRHAETGAGPVFGLAVRVTYSVAGIAGASNANMYRFAIES